MTRALANLLSHHELVTTLAWKNVAVRYKQAYLGIAWAVIRPVTLMLIFTVMRSFVSIDSGQIPYPVLTFAALIPWIFFQEASAEGVSSVVNNTALVKKIYFPREIFPLTAVATKLIDSGISLLILALMMAWYGIAPTVQVLWLPLILLYMVLAALCVAFAGAAVNVYYRDVGQALPVALGLAMYISPVIYPLQLVKDKLLVHRAAGAWSDTLYTVYTLNPLAGIIDAFQRVVLQGIPPDFRTLLPGFVLVAVVLPFSYSFFKRAESHFADII